MPAMESPITLLHVQRTAPETVEQALVTLFAAEERAAVLRLQGTYRAVLARVSDPTLDATDRYLICRPHPASTWTPIVALGTHMPGLEAALSQALDGIAVFTAFAYDEGLAGYRLARDGQLLDAYLSDPTYFAAGDLTTEQVAARRGHPARFADLLPKGTTAAEFERVVLCPGWWDAYDAAQRAQDAGAVEAPDVVADEEVVDEVDRARCIALALELWGPSEYPFTQELESLTNHAMGPAIALAFA
jgi:hypothetical protein